MSKLLPDPITQSDIEEYLNDYADFSFELRVLKELTDLKLQCQHGGTYDDPITGKSREFDIRALLQDRFIRIHLSIECKNLHDNFPLVVHCLKRRVNESYNELIYTFDPEKNYDSGSMIAAIQGNSKSIRVPGSSLYSKDKYVAKSTDQVGRRTDRTITASDGGVFEKISQAINSSSDLISEAHDLDATELEYLTFVCPVLVVPDSTLWQVKYSDDGARVELPELTTHVSYFIGKEWTVGSGLYKLTYTISHLELITFSQIKEFVVKYLRDYITLFHSTINRADELS
jgi:hypothetical protein